MPDTLAPLVDDLLEFLRAPRPCAEVMEAWRTSCPRLPVWEEANRLGLVQRRRDAAGVEQVSLTAAGAERLRSHRAVRAWAFFQYARPQAVSKPRAA